MRGLIFILLVFCASGLSAQQTSQYTHFMFNYFQINPAVAGTVQCMDIRLGYREQWVGFENNPRTAFASVHTTLKSKSGISKSKHGLGGMAEVDNTGPIARTSLYLAYAYHFQFNRNWMVSTGFYLGFMQYRFDISKIFAENFNDPVLLNGSRNSFVFPDITPGIYAYNNSWVLGVTVAHVLGNKVPAIGDDTRLRRHLTIMASKTFGDTEKLSFSPAILLKHVSKSTPAIDFNLMADYKDQIAIGASYRTGDGFAALIKVKMFKMISLAYSYDITTFAIKVASSNTHEITIGISACPRGKQQGKIPCAAYR